MGQKIKIPRFLDTDNPLESKIEKKVCDFAETLGLAHRKYASPNRRSAPDRIFFRRGRIRGFKRPKIPPCVFFVEFKARGKQPTKAQAAEHEFYRQLGFEVFVIDNVEDGVDLMRMMA